MRNGFDINRIKGNGYLVVPLSMARLSAGQSPKEIYDLFHYFSKKTSFFATDVILLYTGGLYFNAENITYEKRIKTNDQMTNHVLSLRSLIEKNRDFIPSGFHFLPIDYIILNSKYFKLFFKKLKKLVRKDEQLRICIKKDIGEREYSEANENFILEEIVVSHIIRERLVDFPRTLVKDDTWRLIVYNGPYLEADKYQLQNKLLPQTDTINPFRAAQYDYKKKKLFLLSQTN